MSSNLLEYLHSGRLLVLDGATGTELERRGYALQPPVWSAAVLWEAPGTLQEIHRDYAAAGARLITANTFRTHARNLAAGNRQDEAAHWTEVAVRLARDAVGDSAWVAGSQAPLGDCYEPDQTPEDQQQMLEEHRGHARNLARAGVDAILVETQITIREAVAAAAKEVLAFSPAALLLNCLPAGAIPVALPELARAADGLPYGLYPNTGHCDASGQWSDTELRDPANLASSAAGWIRDGARLIGGCCGTTPAHISRLKDAIPPADSRKTCN
ncbi:Homocysteine S-methyltransferase [Maioricimonas rarisocia]|uniref:Homocysteine S-methyltransferase n=1 Tax=Maioricimonas rarisocia TaxID=2528026 RepID=A0A517Z737_9PLAN|nr:homocysteine S-methyltransferase family protein [Maioricimonas rarisocia]QDU38297.1 Homocysteine S-methyltransferase [Maioricimonas rarisocia]